MKTTHFFTSLLGLVLLITLIVKAPFTDEETTKNSTASHVEPIMKTSVLTESSTTEAMTPTTSPPSLPKETPAAKEVLPIYTEETLSQYDGQNVDVPIYIAFESNVYDVTAGREFYQPGGKYHFLAGTDGTRLLKMFGGDLIKEKYPIVGTYR